MLDLADSFSFVGLGQLLVDFTAGSFFAFDLANYYLKLSYGSLSVGLVLCFFVGFGSTVRYALCLTWQVVLLLDVST